MENEPLGLNEQHQNLIRNYLKFNKFGRQKHLKFIELSFCDVVDQLDEPTYTKDEVVELFEKLKELVSDEVTSESISNAHMNVLLIKQMLNQAEKWHLRMTLDFSEIQDRDLLEKVRKIEESDGKLNLPVRLLPLDDGSGSVVDLLRREIENLQVDKDRLQAQLTEAENQLDGLQSEKERINHLCEVKEKELVELKDKSSLLADSKAEKPETEKSDSEQLLGEYEKVLSEQLSVELESMRQEYLKVQSQLTLAEQELERKFNQTTAYSNMKAIIAKKNDLVRELRNQLNNLQRIPQTTENGAIEDDVEE
ncbi:Hypothetical protein NTJ_08914 [Nesidiocoris tenuis]|uniref:Leucine zipper transcription factor-like protein 1 n=1 Tax=Nesidiocoris tenuis TaxID=355587 RepID=A0ABN7AYU7_9HEMI|nr:Hypothetical protein NTJ_08914 [Nesidiocoris tenuis]